VCQNVNIFKGILWAKFIVGEENVRIVYVVAKYKENSDIIR
jgi:hypothetical protein